MDKLQEKGFFSLPFALIKQLFKSNYLSDKLIYASLMAFSLLASINVFISSIIFSNNLTSSALLAIFTLIFLWYIVTRCYIPTVIGYKYEWDLNKIRDLIKKCQNQYIFIGLFFLTLIIFAWVSNLDIYNDFIIKVSFFIIIPALALYLRLNWIKFKLIKIKGNNQSESIDVTGIYGAIHRQFTTNKIVFYFLLMIMFAALLDSFGGFFSIVSNYVVQPITSSSISKSILALVGWMPLLAFYSQTRWEIKKIVDGEKIKTNFSNW